MKFKEKAFVVVIAFQLISFIILSSICLDNSNNKDFNQFYIEVAGLCA